jgi:signal transduction histidine kinase
VTSWRSISVRWLLVGVLVAFTAIVLLVQGIPLASYLRGVEQDRLITGLQRDAFTLAGAAEEAVQSEDAAAIAALSAPVAAYAERSGARVVITDATGTALVTSDGTDVGQDYRNRPEIVEALGGSAVSGQRPSESAGEDLVYVAVPIRSGSDVLGAVRITYPATEVEAVVDEQVRGLLLVGLITLAAAAGIALLIAGLVTGPLRRLRETSEAIAEGDLRARVDTATIGELAAVAESFNTMAERVESVVAAQRGFAGDASHQLRTPLTALRLRVDTADEIAGDPEAVARLMEGMRDDIDRMQRLIDGLLLLARADREDVPVIEVDVRAIATARVEEWAPLAAERGVHLVLDDGVGSGPGDPDRCLALAAPEGVDQIIDNYVDNAVEVAPAGSTIAVGVRRTGDRVVVEVQDGGPGMTPEEAARAFDRFWRGVSTRPGSGLGLAVVKALADASGGEVALRPREDGAPGTVAVLTLTTAGSNPASQAGSSD